MIVDAHVHLFPDRLAEAIRRWFSEHAWEIRYRIGVAEAVRTLREGGVARMVALPYAHKPGMARALNDFTLVISREHPEVVPCCTVFPGEEGAEEILEEALAGPFAGVKIHSHVMRIAPDDERLDPVFRACARHHKPLVIHCGREPASAGYGVDVRALSGAARLRRALERHPDTVCIVPHLGWDEPAEFEAMLDEFEHLYLDTTMAIAGYLPDAPRFRAPPVAGEARSSAGGPAAEILRRRPDRILYGTDFPNLPYEWSRELDVVRGLRLPPSDEARVLGGTAARLFGIA
jgi:predicted TIM-barrel fold metal-dependent hydrolase